MGSQQRVLADAVLGNVFMRRADWSCSGLVSEKSWGWTNHNHLCALDRYCLGESCVGLLVSSSGGVQWHSICEQAVGAHFASLAGLGQCRLEVAEAVR